MLGNQRTVEQRPIDRRQRPPLHHRCLLLIALLAAAPAAAGAQSPAPPSAAPEPLQQVRVWMPQGLRALYPRTERADAVTKFVTIENVRATNPSTKEYQRFGVRDFHLIAFDRHHHAITYFPVVRPGFASQDFHSNSLALPLETVDVTVTFQVPNEIDEANFEFIPNWMDDAGGYTDFMYYPTGKAL
jgi:hypothetical protein